MADKMEDVRGLLQQALDILEENKRINAKHKALKKPLSQIDYFPVVARVLGRNPNEAMYYRDIAKVIQEERLIDYEDVDVELVNLNSHEQVPRMVIRVRDAILDTPQGLRFFERGNKKGHYKLSAYGRSFYAW